MSVYNKVMYAVKHYDLNRDDLLRLIALAYMIGREQATVSVTDRFIKLAYDQMLRAFSCRYYKMALRVVGYEVYDIRRGDYWQKVSRLCRKLKTKVI